MVQKTKKQVKESFEKHCNSCLRLAVDEYLQRAGHGEMRKLKVRIDLLLEGPCKTEFCQDDCDSQRSAS